jgi:hypothetical protein
MPQCQFPVFCCFVFQKSYTGNILRIGRNEDRNSYFSRMKDEDQKRDGVGPEGRLTMGWCAPPPSWLRPGVVRPPWWPSDAAPPPIKSLPKENPKTIVAFPRTVPQRRHHQRQISGDRSLYSGTLPGWGSALGAISIDVVASSAISIDFTTISTNLAVSYDEEGVVLPQG